MGGGPSGDGRSLVASAGTSGFMGTSVRGAPSDGSTSAPSGGASGRATPASSPASPRPPERSGSPAAPSSSPKRRREILFLLAIEFAARIHAPGPAAAQAPSLSLS